MSKLAAIKKQIAALEAEAERIAKQEMAGAIAKVKEIMAEFGLTIEQLQSTVAGKTRSNAKKAKPKRAGGGVAKYADPKTGKTWSGFGRAPAWIAGAKNRAAFLVDKSGVKPPEAVVKARAAKKKSVAKKAPAQKVAKAAVKIAATVAKKAARVVSVPATAKKKPSAKKASPKAAAKKSPQKRVTSSASGAQAPADIAATSAT
jgi:DNA-binding protein H-NS